MDKVRSKESCYIFNSGEALRRQGSGGKKLLKMRDKWNN